MIAGFFQRQKPKETTKTKVSHREKKEIYNKAVKENQLEKRKALSSEINKPKESEANKPQKEHFSEIEVISFDADELKTYQHRVEHYKGVDEQIIFDEQFLLNEDDDPDKVYQELKKKQQRRSQMDSNEEKLRENIEQSYGINNRNSTNENNENAANNIEQESEAFIKIRDYLKRSPAADRLDFTQNLLKMAQELGKQLTISGILPSLQLLANDNDSIKIALIDQLNPIASFLIESHDSQEYQKWLSVMVPILNEWLYDRADKVKRKAVKGLVEFWDLLTPNDRGDYILKFMLELAHEEDDEKARVTALQILNKVAGKLDNELCEKFVVKEIKSLAIDPYELVRKNVAANLNNVCKMVNREWFLQEIFPLLKNLGEDNDAEVRNSCVEQVSRISSVCPAVIRTGQLEDLYLKFMLDKNKKVKINSFKHLGRFLETLQNLQINDEFLELYTETGLRSKNKDVLFFWAYNIPGILFILRGDSWNVLEELYIKLSKIPDVRVRKTLAHSIHEIAQLIGRQRSEELLTDFVNEYLKDNLKEVRSGIIKHLHDFWSVIGEEERIQYLKVYENAEEDKSMIDLYAENIGDFSKLFPAEKVTEILLPLFYKLSKSRLAHVRKLASHNLAKILEVYKEDTKMQEDIIEYVQNTFWKSDKYFQRQAYAYMAASVMNTNKELFDNYMKVSFWNLAKDRVTNVRIILARVLNEHIKANGEFYFDFEINKALYLLKKDLDIDVQEHMQDVTLVIQKSEIEKKLAEEASLEAQDVIQHDLEPEKSLSEQSGNQSEDEKLDSSFDNKDNSEGAKEEKVEESKEEKTEEENPVSEDKSKEPESTEIIEPDESLATNEDSALIEKTEPKKDLGLFQPDDVIQDQKPENQIDVTKDASVSDNQ